AAALAWLPAPLADNVGPRQSAAEGREWSRLDCMTGNPRLRPYDEGAGYTVVGEQPFKEGAGGSKYSVTLLEKRLVPAGR
ncbi:hypothetical protein ACWC2K_00005, partial [Streptomyces chattanoogensis]